MPFRSIRRKLFIVLVAPTLFFGLSMVVFAQTVVRSRLVEHLKEKGVVIARKAASDSVNLVITERYFEISMMLRELRNADPDVLYAYLVDEDGRDLAQTFSGSTPLELKQAHAVDPLSPSSIKRLETDKGPVLDIGVPLLRGQIGELHLGLSLKTIHRDVNEIVLLIVLFSAGALAVGFAAAIGYSRVITRPLVRLAGAAETFGRGEVQQPVNVVSDDEVGELARVFNEMMEARNASEEELELLVEQLQRTLSEVKTLRGFLPICSSCKKIRRDEGSWQQIESYVSEHSEAHFSHGLCPECAKRLYPEYWDGIKGTV